MSISPARQAAFEMLLRIEQTEAYASELLHSAKYSMLSSADHGLATEMVMGVLRWRQTLDGEIAEYARSPLLRLDPEVLTALRLGAYQIRFLNRIPARAAIHESVELVKQARKRSAAGMTNAVLRRLSEGASSPSSPDQRSWQATHPEWIVKRWEEIYGEEIARTICDADQSAPRTATRLSPFVPQKTRGDSAARW
jgi:16S rRNA (cytosine967-C5)-methyltransferase